MTAADERSCQVCGDTLERTDAVACAACGTWHHQDCWAWYGRCSTFGCGSVELRDAVEEDVAEPLVLDEDSPAPELPAPARSPGAATASAPSPSPARARRRRVQERVREPGGHLELRSPGMPESWVRTDDWEARQAMVPALAAGVLAVGAAIVSMGGYAGTDSELFVALFIPVFPSLTVGVMAPTLAWLETAFPWWTLLLCGATFAASLALLTGPAASSLVLFVLPLMVAALVGSQTLAHVLAGRRTRVGTWLGPVGMLLRFVLGAVFFVAALRVLDDALPLLARFEAERVHVFGAAATAPLAAAVEFCRRREPYLTPRERGVQPPRELPEGR